MSDLSPIIPDQVHTFLTTVRTLSLKLYAWVDVVEEKIKNAENPNFVDNFSPDSPEKIFTSAMMDRLGKIRKEITEELPSGSLEASVLKSFEDFVNQQVNDVYINQNFLSLDSASSTHSGLVIECVQKSWVTMSTWSQNQLKFCVTISDKVLFGPASFLELRKLIELKVSDRRVFVLKLPLTPAALSSEGSKVKVQVLFYGKHIEGSPYEIPSESKRASSDQRQTQQSCQSQNKPVVPLGDSRLDESDLKSLTLGMRNESDDSQLMGEENTSLSGQQLRLLRCVNYQPLLPTVQEISSESLPSGGRCASPGSSSNSSQVAAEVQGNPVEPLSTFPGVGQEGADFSFMCDQLNETTNFASRTWCPKETCDSKDSGQQKTTFDPKHFEIYEAIGPHKVVKELLPEFIPLDQPSPVPNRVASSIRPLDLDDQADGVFTPHFSSTVTNLQDILKRVALGNKPDLQVDEQNEPGKKLQSIKQKLSEAGSWETLNLPTDEILGVEKGGKFYPQSLTCDPELQRLYIVDVKMDKVLLFENLKFAGFWANEVKFNSLGYIACLENHEVAALDKSGLYLLNKEGKLIKKILDKNAFQLRGLAFGKDLGLIFSLEIKNEQTSLVAINFKTGELVSGLKLDAGTLNPVHQMMCRFFVCVGHSIFITDTNNDCIYIANHSTGMTSTIDLKTKDVRAPTGISALDNLVFFAAGGFLHVLEGEKYLFSNRDLDSFSPHLSGITVSGSRLFVADFGNSAIHVINFDKS